VSRAAGAIVDDDIIEIVERLSSLFSDRYVAIRLVGVVVEFGVGYCSLNLGQFQDPAGPLGALTIYRLEHSTDAIEVDLRGLDALDGIHIWLGAICLGARDSKLKTSDRTREDSAESSGHDDCVLLYPQ